MIRKQRDSCAEGVILDLQSHVFYFSFNTSIRNVSVLLRREKAQCLSNLDKTNRADINDPIPIEVYASVNELTLSILIVPDPAE